MQRPYPNGPPFVENDEGGQLKVQQKSTATYAAGIDLIRPQQTSELHQRPASTSMQLVHTEEVNRCSRELRHSHR